MATDFKKLAPRFWSKVLKSSEDECWLWQAAKDRDGYGVFGLSAKVKSIRAHRMAYMLAKGDPKMLLVLHTCDTPACVNPAHLFLGTVATNMQDKVAKGRHVSGMAVKPQLAARGSKHGNALLTEQQVLEMRARYIPRVVTLEALGREYGVSPSTVCNAIRYGWRHVSGH